MRAGEERGEEGRGTDDSCSLDMICQWCFKEIGVENAKSQFFCSMECKEAYENQKEQVRVQEFKELDIKQPAFLDICFTCDSRTVVWTCASCVHTLCRHCGYISDNERIELQQVQCIHCYDADTQKKEKPYTSQVLEEKLPT